MYVHTLTSNSFFIKLIFAQKINLHPIYRNVLLC